MPDALPVTLTIEAPSGQAHPLVKKGATLPQEARSIFATQKAGERELALRLYEGEGKSRKLVGDVRAELPPGLPPNTWMQVYVSVQKDLSIAVEVKENLRRLRIEGEVDLSTGKSKRFRAR
jgi:molecular chaperone DnaK (HSP70)